MPDETQTLDFTMQEVEVFECYIRTDFDGDGIAELRKVTYAGDQIIDNEEADHIPFASICPIPMPHKFFGQSLADRAMDTQQYIHPEPRCEALHPAAERSEGSGLHRVEATGKPEGREKG